MLLSLLAFITVVACAVFVGALLADRVAPKGRGAASHALAVAADATQLDRELAPLLAAHPGETGAVLINDGLDAFAARALATQAAGRSLDLQYYLWYGDLCGHLLAREVWQAAERGVRVRLLLDDLNAKGSDQPLLALDAHPNIDVRLYNPFRNRSGLPRVLETVVRALRVNHRMHNKAWIVDGRLAVVGGRNIGEAYFNAAADTNFRDLDLLLIGAAVADSEAIFDQFWNSDAVVPIAALGRRHEEKLTSLLAAADARAVSPEAQTYLRRVGASSGVGDYLARRLQTYWTDKIRILSDPPQKWRRDDRSRWLVSTLVQSIGAAQDEALLISPYFVPGKAGAGELVGMRQRGVRVGIVTNSLAANDVPAVHAGYARYRRPLLDGGVALYELRAQGTKGAAGIFGSGGASLHTKAFALDGVRGFVGSFNLDPRSGALNTEMGALFEHPGLAAAVRQEYERLAGPVLSYRVQLGRGARVTWSDGLTHPPAQLHGEPDAGRVRRGVTKILGWLPIESQL